jgi:thioredoxin 1
MSILELTKENFKESVKEGVCVVDFWAPWCAPCNMMTPILENLSKEATDFKVFKVNVDQEQELGTEFNIMSIPCLKIIKDGEVKEEIIGLTSKEIILNLLKTII